MLEKKNVFLMYLTYLFVLFCMIGFCSTLLGAPAYAQDAMSENNGKGNIIITRKGSILPKKGAEATFTGDVAVELAIPKKEGSLLSGGFVTFQPKARTNWHTHPYGQLLIITEGKGRVQEWGQSIQDVFPGDIVWFPAGLKHWHGGSPESSMSHYALYAIPPQAGQNARTVEWQEAVTDEQYTAQ